jgi:endonuclease YncB( thermonuclease family)
MSQVSRTAILGLALALVALGSACGQTKAQRRYSKNEVKASLTRLEQVGLVIGEFPITGASAVIDGDTIRVKGLDSSLRLLALDTEETFKTAAERNAFAKGWEVYKKEMQGASDRPVKLATPLGEEAKKFGMAFFEGASQVRLERDHPGEIRDYFGRYLAYVMVEKDGRWVNYNLEIVRVGLSPYYTKYGRSRRFHKEFLEAQQQAREAQLGIWDPKKHGYGDYDTRLAWWNKRAETIHRFEKEMEENDRHVVLTRWDALLSLEQRLGQEVVILGSVGEIRLGDRGPTVVKLSRSRQNDFDVVFFDKDVFMASGIQHAKGEYVRVRGVVKKYRNQFTGQDKLQIVVSLPGQVLSPSPQLDRLLADDTKAEVDTAAAMYGDDSTPAPIFKTPPPLPGDPD